MAEKHKMKEFKADYDEKNDSLFVYLDDSVSNGSVEMGNFIFDFDPDGNLKAMEILEASKILKSILFKVIKLSKIKEFRAEMINFRNMASIKFSISDDINTESSSFLIPRKLEKSPSIKY